LFVSHFFVLFLDGVEGHIGFGAGVDFSTLFPLGII
jgi:hypothetical protein